MVRHASLFSQILELIPRREFHNIVRDVGTERYSKGFSSWDHFVAMLFCQLAQAKSLREICGGLCSCLGKLNHLGVNSAPKKSTLAYANGHRSWTLFEMVFYRLVDRCRAEGFARHKLPLPGKLYSLDASVVTLCLSIFDWARYRSTKGAVKIHLVLDHDGYLPVFANITTGSCHDVPVAHQLSFPCGSVVAIDRGYVSFRLFAQWSRDGVFFVTRFKSSMRYRIVQERAVTGPVLADQFIEMTNENTQQIYPHLLRRVVYEDPQTGDQYIYLTNFLGLDAQTVAAVYKERWQIELFFKALKQNLRIKTFIGTSVNAVLTQIWTALIAMVLLKYLKLKAKRGWSLSNLVALLRWNLFTYRDLWKWMDDPFNEPPGGPAPQQLALGF